MHDRATKGLLFLIFLALVLNAFMMLVRPSRAADGEVGRYAIAAYGYSTPFYKRWNGEEVEPRGHAGYFKIDTCSGRVTSGP